MFTKIARIHSTVGLRRTAGIQKSWAVPTLQAIIIH